MPLRSCSITYRANRDLIEEELQLGKRYREQLQSRELLVFRN